MQDKYCTEKVVKLLTICVIPASFLFSIEALYNNVWIQLTESTPFLPRFCHNDESNYIFVRDTFYIFDSEKNVLPVYQVFESRGFYTHTLVFLKSEVHKMSSVMKSTIPWELYKYSSTACIEMPWAIANPGAVVKYLNLYYWRQKQIFRSKRTNKTQHNVWLARCLILLNSFALYIQR